MRPVARRAFQYCETLIQDGIELRQAHHIARLQMFQRAEEGTPYAARPVGPIRVNRNPLEAGKKQLKDLDVFRGSHRKKDSQPAETITHASAPGEGRTLNHQIRSLLLYPLSYGGVVRDYTLTNLEADGC